MNHSGDAAEQIVRMSLEGVEVAARITGTTAKEVALLLMAALKSDGGGKLKTKGRARLESMLKSGKALEIFSVGERDLRTFVREAKRYGIVYCVLRNAGNAPDGLCDIMVKADDAPKINRIVERFKFAAVDKAKIESEIERDTAERAEQADAPESADRPGKPEINDVDGLLDELTGTGEGKAPTGKTPDPFPGGGGSTTDGRGASSGPPPSPKTSPSAPSSGSKENSERPIWNRKPSVRKELREITAAHKAKEAEAAGRTEPVAPEKPKEPPAVAHKQPQNRRKPKSKKAR
jgi:hypothetical protein